MSRLALGIVCLNEAPWLHLHLPAMLRAAAISGVVCVDGGSTDRSPDIVRAIATVAGRPSEVQVRPWGWHFADQQNAVIDLAEARGYDALLKWDPDELMFPDQIDGAANLIAMGTKAIAFPRLNFEYDRLHYAPYTNPRDLLDFQTRMHVLGQGFRWRGQLHASVNAWDIWSEDRSADNATPRELVRLLHAWIYHYEGIKPMEQRALKWLNYARVREGQPPLDVLPDGYHIPTAPARWIVPFVGAQPLAPEDIGRLAPYSEVGA